MMEAEERGRSTYGLRGISQCKTQRSYSAVFSPSLGNGNGDHRLR